MKRKIILSILILSLSASFAGCKTAARVESTVSDITTAPAAEKDTSITDNRSTDSDKKRIKSTYRDTSVDRAELISSDDIKELKSEDSSDTDNAKGYTPEPGSVDIGGITLNAEFIPFDSELKLSDAEDMDGTVFGDTLYILNKKNINTFTVSDTAVSADSFKLRSKYDRIDADVFGNIYLSGKKLNAAMLNSDGTLSELDLTGKLAMSKIMNFGLSCTGKDIISKYADGEAEQWIIDSLSSPDQENTETNTDAGRSETPRFTKVQDIEFVGNHILAGGKFNDGKDTLRAAVFDYDGNQTALTDNKISGDEIVSMNETDNGLVISTGSNLSLWSSDGTQIGQSKSSQITSLFGTEDPLWINDVFAMDDGSILALCSGENNNGQDIALLYRVYGI